MKRFLRVFYFLLIASTQILYSQSDPQIMDAVSRVNLDTLKSNLSILSGEKPFTPFSGPIYITSRHSNSDTNPFAAIYINRKLASYGLPTYEQNFMTNGKNVYAIQYGKEKPNQIVIICAHYDNMPSSGPAPGADDNGSGTVAVMEAARVLSNFNTSNTIIYLLLDNEEQGLFGGRYYAEQAKLRNDNILAVFNLDMIGYDSNNDNKVEIHTRNYANSNQLAETMLKQNSFYGIGLFPTIKNPGTTSSDHSAFWDYNFSAVLLIEDTATDFNKFYHTSNDNMSNMNFSFWEKCTKLAVATTANAAKIISSTSAANEIPLSFTLHQNYPNPFNPSTKIKYSLEKDSHVKLIVYDILGNEVVTLVDEFQNASSYEIDFNSSSSNSTLTSGVYFYAMYAGNNKSIKKMVLAR